MKRSDMITVIRDYLDLVEDCTKDEFSNNSMAEYIIGCCETWGMTPPNQYANTNEFRFEWEPEEES